MFRLFPTRNLWDLLVLSSCKSGDQEDMVPLWSLWELVSFGKALKQIGTKRTAKIPHAAELCATWTYLDIDVGDEHGWTWKNPGARKAMGFPFLDSIGDTLWWTNILQWKITIFNGKIHYKWSFSIAMLVHQRVSWGWAKTHGIPNGNPLAKLFEVVFVQFQIQQTFGSDCYVRWLLEPDFPARLDQSLTPRNCVISSWFEQEKPTQNDQTFQAGEISIAHRNWQMVPSLVAEIRESQFRWFKQFDPLVI